MLNTAQGILIGIRRGMTEAGTLVRRPALRGAAIAVGGILAWAIGLYSA